MNLIYRIAQNVSFIYFKLFHGFEVRGLENVLKYIGDFVYSYNEIKHRDYEIENMLDQSVRAGINYNFNFNSSKLEPFKKNDSLFTSNYLKILKEISILI